MFKGLLINSANDVYCSKNRFMIKHTSLVMLDKEVRSRDIRRVRAALRGMVLEAEQSMIRLGFYDIARRALKVRDDQVYWSACAVLSYFVDRFPGQLFELIRAVVTGSSDDQRTALATCLLEHLLERNFDEIVKSIAEERNAQLRFDLADVLSRCWPCGEAKRSAKWQKLETLLCEYPQLAEDRPDLSFLLK
jgi:hypothetical protein